MASLPELDSLGVGQSREPRRRGWSAGRLCPPIHLRHALGGRAEAGQTRSAASRLRDKGLDDGPWKPSVPSGRHECSDIPVVRPAPQRRRRDPQEATRLTEA